MFYQFNILVGATDRRGVIWRLRDKVFGLVQPAHCLQAVQHIIGHFALIKSLCAVFGNASQDLCLTRCPKDLPGFGGLAVQQKKASRPCLKRGRMFVPVKGNFGGNWHTSVGILNRRRQNML